MANLTNLVKFNNVLLQVHEIGIAGMASVHGNTN